MFDNFLRNLVNPLGNMPSEEETVRKKRGINLKKYWNKQKRVVIKNEDGRAVGERAEVTKQERTTKKLIIDNQTKQEKNLLYCPPQPSRWYKPIKQAKLIIFLIENSDIVCKEEEIVKKIINSQVGENTLFCIISYSKEVSVSDIYEAKLIREVQLIDRENVSEELCLYDALLEARITSLKRYFRTKEELPQEFRINSVELIGIGRCIDTYSKSSKEDGIKAFCQISFAKSITKYYCIDDSYFVNPAEIGFRSIGAIKRNFFI